jgi:pimeloyl-ACP methyl ester carboxylesterase
MVRAKWKRRLTKGAIFLLLVYVLVIFTGVLDPMIIGPRPGTFDAGGATRHFINISGKAVEVWVSHSETARHVPPDAYVLEFCGNSTRAEQIAQYVPLRWKNFPVETWVMNYPGAGGSDGSLRLKNIAPAALGVFDEIRRRSPRAKIFVEGNSLGTVAALCVASQRDVAGCVLHNPVPLKQLIIGHYGWWNLWLVATPVAWQVPTKLDSVVNAKKVNAPCLFILAENDDFVLPKYQQLITSSYAGEKRFVRLPDSGHWSSVEGEALNEVERGITWLWFRSR